MKRSWYVGNIEITRRELAASVTIITLMLLLGFVIAGKLEQHQVDKNSEYYKAVQITDTNLFQYGMDTDLGNAFVYGDLEAVDPVTYPEIGGEYLYVKKVKERYTMHTRTVTITVNGKSQTRTEIYWTWDAVGSEEIHSQTIRFLSVEMDYRKIQRPGTDHIKTIKESSHIRYVYYGCKTRYAGTIYADLRNGTIPDETQFYEGREINEVIESLTSGIGVNIFWIVWIALIGAIVFRFFYADNYWLED